MDDDGGSPYESYYRGPLNNLLIPYDDWNNLLSGSPGSELNEYSCVIWFTGNEDSATLTPQDETDLSTFMDGGGNLFLSGQNIGEEIGGSSTFYSNYLQAVFLEANANDNLLSGVTSDPISNGLNLVIQGANGAGNANSEDKITPLGASSVFTYTNVSGTGAQRYDSGTFRVVYFAFPFEAIHGAGSFASRDTVMSRVLNWVCPSSVGVEEPESGDLRFPISDFRLLQNVPNPFTQFTLISFQIPQSPFVKGGIKGDFAEGGTRGIPVQLAIYDITGRLVKTLVDETKEPGVYQLPITPPQVDQLPGSGVYFYRLKVGGNGNTPLVMTRKMTLLK